jgi:glycosyltransferase involved in cell wall biosynthesis
MKILLAHNSYQQQGGEDSVVKAEVELLRSHANEVMVYRRNNLEIKRSSLFSSAVSTIWSRRTSDELGLLCDTFQPDIIHAHNTFPLISPSLYWLASKRKIPIVQTLHNFRLLCPQAMFLRKGVACEDCLGKVPWRAVTRRCYHSSALQSALIANMLMTHRAAGTYQNRVSAFIAMNGFCRKKFIAGGLPAERIHIKPNFVEASHTPNWEDRRDGLFIGRLSEEKGIAVLIAAAALLSASNTRAIESLRIKIVGIGPLSPQVGQAFKDDYLALKNREEIFSLLHKTLFLVVPSTCYENFPLVVAEAFSCGVPVIASRHGSLADIVNDGVNGLLFHPGDAADLAGKIAWAQANPEKMQAMGRAAYQEYLAKYSPAVNYRIMTDIYRHALVTQGSRDESQKK